MLQIDDIVMICFYNTPVPRGQPPPPGADKILFGKITKYLPNNEVLGSYFGTNNIFNTFQILNNSSLFNDYLGRPIIVKIS